MARKRKTKKYSRRRRGSVGATGAGMSQALAMVAGAVIGRVVSTKFADKVNPKILAGGQIALGLFLPKLVKNKFATGIGQGMIVNGGVSVLQSFGVISAISGIGADVQVDYLGEDEEGMSGSAYIQEIAGGMDSDELGYYDEGIMSGSSDISVLAGDDYDY